MNLQRFPCYPLTFGPTPIQPLKRLSDHLGGKVLLYAKREDCNSGFVMPRLAFTPSGAFSNACAESRRKHESSKNSADVADRPHTRPSGSTEIRRVR